MQADMQAKTRSGGITRSDQTVGGGAASDAIGAQQEPSHMFSQRGLGQCIGSCAIESSAVVTVRGQPIAVRRDG